MRLGGTSKPEVCSAARTRSLLSRTAAAGKPVTAKVGNPPEMWTSMVTTYATSPAWPRLRTRASDDTRAAAL